MSRPLSLAAKIAIFFETTQKNFSFRFARVHWIILMSRKPVLHISSVKMMHVPHSPSTSIVASRYRLQAKKGLTAPSSDAHRNTTLIK